MVAEARHTRSVQGRRSVNFKSIAQLRHMRAHGTQIVRYRRDAVVLLDAQFLCVADRCFAASEGPCDRENRQFVNEVWHLFALNNGCLEWNTGHFDDATSFKLLDILNCFSDLRAQSEQYAQQRGSRIVQTNVADDQMSTTWRSSGNEPKSRRRDVARNIKIPRLGNLVAEDRDAAVSLRSSAY